MSDHLLSVMLGVDLTDFYRWKVKTRIPCKASRQACRLVCLVRIGALRTVFDVMHAADLDLEKLITDWEQNQCAKTGQLPAVKVSKPRKPRKH